MAGIRRRPGPVREGRRFAMTMATGVLVGSVAATVAIWQLAVLLGWTASGSAYLASILVDVRGLDAEATHATATTEDNSRGVARLLVIASAMASLAGVVVGLAKANTSPPGLEGTLIVASVTTIAASWAVVHCTYLLRYAHLYYTDPVGGIDFPGDDAPTYRDFAYLSFTVGMTYQVSDTDITATSVRRTLLMHSLISYVFGAVIVAVAINVVAGLV